MVFILVPIELFIVCKQHTVLSITKLGLNLSILGGCPFGNSFLLYARSGGYGGGV